MVSTRPLICKSSSHCINPLVTVPCDPITIGIAVAFIFLSLFSFLARSRNLSLFLLSFCFTLWSARTAKPTLFGSGGCLFVLFFFGGGLFCFVVLLTFSRSTRLAKISEKFVHHIFKDGFWVLNIPLVRIIKVNFLHNSQWITFPYHTYFVQTR